LQRSTTFAIKQALCKQAHNIPLDIARQWNCTENPKWPCANPTSPRSHQVSCTEWRRIWGMFCPAAA